jgi:hypothetical protein
MLPLNLPRYGLHESPEHIVNYSIDSIAALDFEVVEAVYRIVQFMLYIAL